MMGFKSKNGEFKKSEFVRDCVDFVFGFENKRGEIWDHWITFIDSFNFSPKDFYAAIEKELTARKIPSMEISREEFSEGGMLSEKRLYLRMFRERLALYACASPFGSGYFFSCRTVYVPALVRLWHIMATFVFLGLVGSVFLQLLGLTFTIIALLALLFALAAVFRNAAASAVSDLDTFLLKIPVVSTIYQNWFRQDTYYRVDTRMVYLQRIPALVREVADEITAANGAKLGEQYQCAPILDELYKRVPPRGTEPGK